MTSTLDKICKSLLVKEPFWGLFLLGINRRYTDKVPTAAVGSSGITTELLVNEKFWNSLKDDDQRRAILLHELHHIALGHIFMGKEFPYQERFNIAADLEVNCYVQNLPEGALLVRDFGFEPRKGTKWYYNNLPEDMGKSQIVVMPGNGSDGLTTLDDHSGWKDFDGMSEAKKELVQAGIDNNLKEAAEETQRARGTIPECLRSIIDELLKERPRIYDWKKQFRRMLGSEIDVKLKRTYQRESRRFAGSPGMRFMKKIRILVAIDTSGSVSDTELSEFFSEIMHIKRAGASVHIIECDAAIHSEWEFTGLKNVKITGRGGTDFAPAIDYYREHKKEFTCFVFFTDGYAPIDNLDVPNNDMTWVITSEGCRQDYPGKVIYIPKTNE